MSCLGERTFTVYLPKPRKRTFYHSSTCISFSEQNTFNGFKTQLLAELGVQKNVRERDRDEGSFFPVRFRISLIIQQHIVVINTSGQKTYYDLHYSLVRREWDGVGENAR